MRPKLSSVLKEIETQIDSGINLITKVKSLGLRQIQTEIITELAFLRIFIAWENFLENSFTRYSVGGESPSRYKPNRLIRPRNIKHCLDIITINQDYAKWNSAGTIVSRSEIFFRNGEPYKNAIQGASSNLDDMNTIRNRIAHRSPNSKERFNGFVRRKFGHGRRGMTPGRFLLTRISSGSTDFYINYYGNLIKATANIIVPK